MATKAQTATAPNSFEAFLNLLYEVKFSRHVPLTVILLSAVYAIYRSTHYFESAFKLAWYIALPTATFIELLVLGCGALVFITNRDLFVAEQRKQDIGIAQLGAAASVTLLGIALAALIGIAWADAWLVTGQTQPSVIMTLVQVGQSGMIILFVITALLDERELLRTQEADRVKAEAARRANECPYCHKEIAPNNRARHLRSCPKRPE